MFSQNDRARKTDRRLRPLLESLDTRIVPAVLATFNAATGALVINIDNNSQTAQNVGVWSNSHGNLTINNLTRFPGIGHEVASSSVRSIVVNGSNLANKIDLTEVSSRGFRGLDGHVTIKGNGGNDALYGSQFADVIRGGDGNDIVAGYAGKDTLYGDGGNDNLFGGTEKDTFYGGSGTDVAADNKLGDYIASDVEHRRRV